MPKFLKTIKRTTITAVLCTAGLAFSVSAAPLAANDSTENSENDAPSILEIAKADAQTFTASPEVENISLTPSSYSATTPAELKEIRAKKAAKKKAAEEKKRKEEEAKALAAQNVAVINNVTSEAPPAKMNGNFAWPLTNFYSDPQINGYHTQSRPGHDGFDMVAAGGTPIYAATDATVVVSSESYYGYGVAVVLEQVIDGVTVQTTYGHMTNGTRMVQVGDTVKAGQQIGQVGNTGHSFGDHLHFEVRLNGVLTNPAPWLKANLG